jgi:uncharacterized protein YegP (UPF0339 family)
MRASAPTHADIARRLTGGKVPPGSRGLFNRDQPAKGNAMPGYFELHKSTDEKFVFNLKADNNEIILTSQTYSTKQHALDGMESVRKHSSKDAQYTRKQSTAKQPYFVLNSTNGETIGSSQMYASGSAMESGIASVKENGATKTSKDSA